MVYAWYVAAALAGLEATALFHLSREGITAFSPMITVDRRPARLFPGYVFVELGNPNEASIVNRTRGVHKMLPIHAGSPLALPKGFVDELRGRLSEGDFDERAAEDVVYKFVPEEEVLIKHGPFQDHRGKFIRYHKGSGVVLAALLGREIAVKIPTQSLAPIRPRLAGGRGALAAAAA